MDEVIIIAKGVVQGVFFRASCRSKASDLSLNGYAKNLDNGDVEVLIQGSQKSIGKFIDWIRKGPSEASIDKIIITRKKPEEKLTGFKVL